MFHRTATSNTTFGVSKSGSPAANFMMGTPDSLRAVARSAMTMVLDGFKEFARGLTEVSTAMAWSVMHSDLMVYLLPIACMYFLVFHFLSYNQLYVITSPTNVNQKKKGENGKAPEGYSS